jgi:hypothetical protein
MSLRVARGREAASVGGMPNSRGSKWVGCERNAPDFVVMRWENLERVSKSMLAEMMHGAALIDARLNIESVGGNGGVCLAFVKEKRPECGIVEVVIWVA